MGNRHKCPGNVKRPDKCIKNGPSHSAKARFMHRSLFNCKVEMGKTFQTRRGAWGKSAETQGDTATPQARMPAGRASIRLRGRLAERNSTAACMPSKKIAGQEKHAPRSTRPILPPTAKPKTRCKSSAARAEAAAIGRSSARPLRRCTGRPHRTPAARGCRSARRACPWSRTRHASPAAASPHR